MLTHLAAAVLPVRDLALATAWYSHVLERAPSVNEPYYVAFDVGGQDFALIPLEPGAEPGPQGSRPYWAVDDLEAVLARWQGSGAVLHETIASAGEVRFASVCDPDGNAIGFVQIATA